MVFMGLVKVCCLVEEIRMMVIILMVFLGMVMLKIECIVSVV